MPLCKEEDQEAPEAKGDFVHEPEMEERRRKRLNSEVSDEKQSEESQPCCSDANYQSAIDVEYQSTSDSKYQCSADTKYQSIYVMSDQKDECIIATEVRPTS
ncbi:hypothetical protein CRUP_022364 [Coryphaenoides rupestris]|nr:hypothetical protein CRUP_022364 [Coryphaenoides rupestris]